MSKKNISVTEQQDAFLQALFSKLTASEQSGFSDHSPEQIRETAKGRLKRNVL
ncbi:MAG: hypothetical protein AAF636_18760 [Pseudomonadota bacterium]